MNQNNFASHLNEQIGTRPPINSNVKLAFRVWDTKKNTYVDLNSYSQYASECAITHSGRLILSETGWYSEFSNSNPNDYVIELFSGFFDKNQLPIYEGDRGVYYNSYEESQGGQLENTVAEVTYYSGCFRFDGTPIFEFK